MTVKENKYLKALDRIKKNLPFPVNWTDEDIEHYKTVMEAFEKQIPQKLLPEQRYYGIGECSRCGVVFIDNSTKYCGNCGQAIDWEEGEADA